MDDKQINTFIATLTEQIMNLAGHVTKMQASVNVLKGLAVLEMSPEDPLGGAQQLQDLEKMLLETDPTAQAHQQVSEIMEAVKLWKKHGGGIHEA